MEKMKMHSMDVINDNVRKIARLFPECITEVINEDNKLEKVVDFDKLKALFSSSVVEGKKERYIFTWPDKSKAMGLVNQPINATLRPCREESVNFDTTENLYIEGDNLDVLKLLRETYYGKIKMIYIDPPYNTGNDFIYKDKYKMSDGSYKYIDGDYDDEGNQLVKNPNSEGKYHTNWLNMMYPRLKIARDFLSEDGVIFVSIDDHEQHNLRKMMDEIFGENAYVATLHCQMSTTQGMKVKAAQKGNIVKNAEFILCYSKDGHQDIAIQPMYDLRPEYDEHYSKIIKEDGTIGDIKELYDYSKPCDLNNKNKLSLSEAFKKSGEFEAIVKSNLDKIVCYDKFSNDNFDDCTISEGHWKTVCINGKEYILTRNSKGNIKQLLKLSDSWGATDGFYHEVGLRKIRGDWWNGFYIDMGNVSKEGGVSFSNGKKPVRLIYQLIKMVTGNQDSNSIILDFFSGSATTAHAVMKLNSEDGGHRRFIMIQLPDKCNKNSKEKDQLDNLCEIGKERIRNSGREVLEEKKPNSNRTDIGFRVLKLDSSNMTDVYYKPDELKQDELANLISNIKEGRTAEDLLFQVMLELGVLLSSKIDTIDINEKTVFNVNEGYLMACFEEEVDEETVIEVAKKKPQFFVMRDSSMTSDSMMVNFDQIFDRFSPKTTRKMI